MRNEHGLTQAEERFARLMVEGLSQSDAFRQAHARAARWAPETVHQWGSRWAASSKVQARVAMLQAELAEKSVLKASDILRETARIALSSPAGLVRRTVRDGNESVTFMMPDELSPDVAAAVASFEIDDLGRVEYRFWDKNTALERAARILGMFSRDNAQRNQAAELFKALGLGGVSPVIGPAADAGLPDDVGVEDR